MSTIGLDSWAVDLAEVGAVYPLQGWEFPMVIVCVVFWLGWHVIQMKREKEHFAAAEKVETDGKSLDRY